MKHNCLVKGILYKPVMPIKTQNREQRKRYEIIITVIMMMMI